MVIVQGQFLRNCKGSFGLPRTSTWHISCVKHCIINLQNGCFRSRWRGSVVKFAQEGDEVYAFTGQQDELKDSHGSGRGSRRPPDEIDRLISRVALYIRNPGAAVVDVWKFVTDALRMTRYLHTPALYTSFVRSVLVVAVVILFCALVFGLDRGLSLLFKIQSQG